MKIVKISTNFSDPLINQTPKTNGIWENYKFFVDKKLKKCDYWVVFEGLKNNERCLCPENNVIFITGEPPSFRTYDKRFLKQFSLVITCHKKLQHSNKLLCQQSLPWHIVRNNNKINYDYLKKMKPPVKSKLISIICSNKSFSEGHKRRLMFVSALKNNFKDVDIFGRGINEIEDKSEAIFNYRYHIAIENSRNKDYWTEKLADSYLGFSYPFYFGCSNIQDYFPRLF